MNFPWHYYLMAGIYCIGGLFHFLKPRMYIKIIPAYLPKPRLLVILSGIAEMILGSALLFPEIQGIALAGIILMLLVFLLVHINMLTSKKAGLGLPKWILIARIPLQFGLVYWAFYYLNAYVPAL
ncbi:hypothetical protein C7S20_11205 [Christiangramia fulva]|uniref:DoxX family protein n=1 Tax=Christiangramia fulva TaxID=2126553 RepID=A0A2R3Z666_9FLAO|nr:hypothetical protein [Christiangramia fulva]AVR45771.1 hypothetical protein C7S20_11205 [Christiangramia fulva]